MGFIATYPVVLVVLLLSSLFISGRTQAKKPKLPDASSTLLRMHRLYLRQPPHDTALYDLLKVSPNATAAQITKSYRRLSRLYHPDKQQQKTRTNYDNDDDIDAESMLERVRHAYEVLKQDSTRLPYHRYGLMDVVDAVLLLSGGGRSSSSFQKTIKSARDRNNPALHELFHLMGFDPLTTTTTTSDHDQRGSSLFNDNEDNNNNHTSKTYLAEERKYRDRVWLVANNLAETIRPVVEGAVSEAFLADLIASQCDRLKTLPLGAQIIRCIGRAYRYKGRRILRRYHAQPNHFLLLQQQQDKGRRAAAAVPELGQTVSTTALLDFTDGVRGRFRRMKQVVNAAVASGKVVLSETKHRRSGKSDRTRKRASIAYHWDARELGDVVVEDSSETDYMWEEAPSEEDIRENERRKAQQAVLESLQVEALWQISKMELDRVIRAACDLILESDHFFQFSMTTTSSKSRPLEQGDGWVGSSGMAIPARVGRVRAAAALVMIGDIMVQRSKEGTTWME